MRGTDVMPVTIMDYTIEPALFLGFVQTLQIRKRTGGSIIKYAGMMNAQAGKHIAPCFIVAAYGAAVPGRALRLADFHFRVSDGCGRSRKSEG